MKNNIKWILFDFGGCLDSDGMHSRTLFFSQFKKFGLISDNHASESFENAYTASDKKIINESLVVNSKLNQMNQIMCNLIALQLDIDKVSNINNVAMAITNIQSFYLRRNSAILKKLQNKFKLGVVSNFSGNLKKILNEFSLSSYFDFILDSYHVGHSKPDPELFKLALRNCDVESDKVLFVGDNLIRDVIPAKSLGMNTILLSSNVENDVADYTFSSLEELLIVTQSI